MATITKTDPFFAGALALTTILLAILVIGAWSYYYG